MSSDFESIRILDNFYQTSPFFPMPVVLMSTVSESGATNLGQSWKRFRINVAKKKTANYQVFFAHLFAIRHATAPAPRPLPILTTASPGAQD